MKAIFVGLLLTIGHTSLWAQSAINKALYAEARASFKAEDYVSALRDFAAFQGANESYLEKHPHIKKAINQVIALCQANIRRQQQEQEDLKNGIVRIQADGIFTSPGPTYLLPQDTTLNPDATMGFSIRLDFLREDPFSGVRITVLSNASEDSLTQWQYVQERTTWFQEVVLGRNFSPDRIQWKVTPYDYAKDRLSYCMNYYRPPAGSLCLEYEIIPDAELFEIE